LSAQTTVGKRIRERNRADRQTEKSEKRRLKKLERQTRPEQETDSESEDPDLAGIVPGPQKLDPELFGAESLTDTPSGD
jgi:hypothetical protein